MKTVLLIFLSVFIQLSACPSFSLKDATYNDIKRAGSKMFWKVNTDLTALSSATSEVQAKACWTQLSTDWLVLHTKLNNWLRLLKNDQTAVSFMDTLKIYENKINSFKQNILSNDFSALYSTVSEFRRELMLFYHFNPLDAAKSAVETRSFAQITQVVADMKTLKNLPEKLMDYQNKISQISDKSSEVELQQFLIWRESIKEILKKELADYFEKNSWY